MPGISSTHEIHRAPQHAESSTWPVLIADDDEMVHAVTKLVLKDLTFEGKPVELVKATSAAGTIEALRSRSDIALVLLDVVMETLTAGLDIVPVIREELENRDIRIIIRTGQAGYADESDVIRRLDVNGFTRKEELRHENLRDAVILGLRSYRDIQLAKAVQR